MYPTHCARCGASKYRVSNFRRKDFPADFYFIDCAACGASQGVADIGTILEATRSGKIDGRNHPETLQDNAEEIAV